MAPGGPDNPNFSDSNASGSGPDDLGGSSLTPEEAERPNEGKPSEKKRRAEKQGYAEFHRRLGELLEQLTYEADVAWAGELLLNAFPDEETRFVNTEVGHELHINSPERNVYRKAVYLVPSAEPYKAQLDAILKVQTRVMALTNAARPRIGLLEPTLIENALLVRLRPLRNDGHKRLKVSTYLKELERYLAKLKETALKFERVSLTDEATLSVHKELEHLEGITEVIGREEGKLLVRTKKLNVRMSVYTRDGRQSVYLRDEGAILAGPPKVEVKPVSPLRRADYVSPEMYPPLAAFRNVDVYRLEDWEGYGEEIGA